MVVLGSVLAATLGMLGPGAADTRADAAAAPVVVKATATTSSGPVTASATIVTGAWPVVVEFSEGPDGKLRAQVIPDDCGTGAGCGGTTLELTVRNEYPADLQVTIFIGGQAWHGPDLFWPTTSETYELPSAFPGPAAPPQRMRRPFVDLVTVNSGPTTGGQTITIRGENFSDGTGILFGDTPAASVKIVDHTTLRVVTPAHAPGGYDITAVNRNGRSPQVDAAAYTFVPAP